jgi:hypothetical protein
VINLHYDTDGYRSYKLANILQDIEEYADVYAKVSETGLDEIDFTALF